MSLFLFFFSLFMGYMMGDSIPAHAFEGVLENIPDPSNSDVFGMFSAIFTNNLIASLMFVLSGLLLGIPPLLFIVFNGFFVGWIAFAAAKEVGLGFVILTLIPHGFIEIPTISFSAAMGVGFAYQLIQKLQKRDGLQAYAMNTIIVFVTRIMPFLIISAMIETGLIYVIGV